MGFRIDYANVIFTLSSAHINRERSLSMIMTSLCKICLSAFRVQLGIGKGQDMVRFMVKVRFRVQLQKDFKVLIHDVTQSRLNGRHTLDWSFLANLCHS